MRILCVLAAVAGLAAAVDRNNFKTCDQSAFCKRNRALEVCAASHPWRLVLSDIRHVALRSNLRNLQLGFPTTA